MANDVTTSEEVVEQAADVAVETSEEVVQNVEETPVEEKPKKARKSSKKSKTEETTESELPPTEEGSVDKTEKEAAELEADEDAAAEVEESGKLDIITDAEISEAPQENENVKSHFYKFRKEGIQLGLDPAGFVSTILMKKFRFGVILRNKDQDYCNEANKVISYVKSALNKLNDPDIVVHIEQVQDFYFRV